MNGVAQRLAALALVCLAGLPTATRGAALDLYVSPDGDDRWSGALREPNAARTDGPCASLAAARDALRRRRAAGQASGAVTVWLSAGTYAQSATLALDERDSGQPDAPVTYRAAPGAEVRLCGGRDIPPAALQPVTDPALLERILDPEARQAVRRVDLRALGITDCGVMRPRGFRRPYVPAPLEVFIDGEALWLARWPNQGTVPIGKVLDPGSVPRDGDFSDRGGVFEYTDDRHARWTQAEDLWLSGLWNYGFADDTIRVAAIDAGKRTVAMAQATMYGLATGAPWQAYYALNLIEEIDQPGEYVVDRAQGVLYLYPPTGFSAQRSRVQVSLLEEPLLALEGASHIAFEGIVFECSRGMGAYVERGTGNRFGGCTFRNLGIVGVCIGKGTQPLPVYAHAGTAEPASRMLGSWHEHIYDNTTFDRQGGSQHRIESCDIYNIGAGGISLGGGDRRTLVAAGNAVRNCHIHHFNRLDRSYKAAVNIDGVGNRIEHCLIHDCPNSAIYLHGNDHLIEYNEVHHSCQVADDMGVLYLGRDPSEAGNVIRYNLFHHNGSEHGATGTLYFDDGAVGVVVIGNVFFRNRGGMWINGGYRHRFENNLFIETPAAISSGWAPAEWHRQLGEELWHKRLRTDLDITRPPYSERYPELLQLYQASPDENALHGQEVLHNVALRSGAFGTGRNRLEGNWETEDDPGFVDLGAMDLRLRPEAALLAKVPGFRPIPFERMGLYLDGNRRSLPIAAPHIVAREQFVGRTQVRLVAPRRALALVYTLDGTDPTAASPRYQDPFLVERDTIVCARALADAEGTLRGPPATLRLTRIQPTLPTAAKVNFAPADVAVTGWLNDCGAPFAMRPDSLAFGWSADNHGASRRRGLNPDSLLDTVVHFSDDLAWEMAVAEGTYELTVCLGDAQYPCEDQTVFAEGVEVARGINLQANEFRRLTARIVVADGGLTLTSVNVPHGPRLTRLAFLEFRRVE
jgi:hypothetical protein